MCDIIANYALYVSRYLMQHAIPKKVSLRAFQQYMMCLCWHVIYRWKAEMLIFPASYLYKSLSVPRFAILESSHESIVPRKRRNLGKLVGIRRNFDAL